MLRSSGRWISASATLIVSGGIVLATGVQAATPSAVTVGVGGAAAATATYSGSVGPGNPDALGPPAPVCSSNSGCEREPVTVKAPSGYTRTHSIALSVSLKYDNSVNGLDLAILDAQGNPIASEFAVSPGAAVTAANVAPGRYRIEVDGDITVSPASYAATVTAKGGPKYVPPARSSGGLTFGRQTLTDPFRLGTEPSIAVGPDNTTIYETPIFGFSTTQSFLSRSVDGGKTFNILGTPGVGKLDNCTGGGDSDVATDNYAGDLYNIDLGGAPEVPARVSHNKGLSFTSSCDANEEPLPQNYFTDRQWLATDLKHKVEWYIYRDGLLTPPSTATVGGIDISKQLYGEYLKYAPLASGPGKAGSAQITFNSLCKTAALKPEPCDTNVEIAGNALTDNSKVSPHYGTTYLALETAKGITLLSFDTSGPKSVVEHVASPGHHQILFPTVAVDRSGVVYMAYTDSTNYRVYLVHTVGTNLNRWTKRVVVNGGNVYTTVMPWIVAGDKGRIDIVFYGTSNPKDPTTNYGPWYPYLAQSLNATATKPQFSQARMTNRPNHIEPVCLSGLGCTTNTGPGGDRELGDFFRVVVDGHGRALVSFADGDNQLGNEVIGGPLAAPSFADFVRQSGGHSLYRADDPLPHVATPTNCVSEGPHHNPVPYDIPLAGAQGPDVAALQLRGSCLTRLPNGNLKATIRLAKLDPQGAVTPPALPTATYMVRWVYKDHVYFAAAEDTLTQWRYFAGQAAPVSDGAAIKYAYYPATTTITGHVDAATKTLTLTVPKSVVGSPGSGARLSTVTAYALTHAAPSLPLPPTAANVTDFPQVADVLPAYDAVLSRPHGAGAGGRAGASGVGADNGSRGSHGSLAFTGSSTAVPVVAGLLFAAGLGCAVVARRSRRRGESGAETAAPRGV